jgi:hypothetical protein
MKKITIFLASSLELKPERIQFELEIYQKCKAWYDRGIFLHLDIWEDLSAKMGIDGSLAEYNKHAQAADIFILLVWNKVGMYTAEEFEKAYGQFKTTQKPFIFTYFKDPSSTKVELSLVEFLQKLKDLRHFLSPIENANDLWNQFNKELERLAQAEFAEFVKESGNRGVIQIGTQHAEKIYNIGHIDQADFS